MLIVKIRVLFQLGLINVVWVLLYRIQLKTGWFKHFQPVIPTPDKPQEFFHKATSSPVDKIDKAHFVPLKAFGWITIDTDTIPSWTASVLNGKSISDNRMHWSEVDEFSQSIGDIKTIWELSRFDWIVNFAANYHATGDDKWLARCNLWLNDWLAHNPINQGVNWRCGQEASIRLMHLITAHQLFSHQALTKDLLSLIEHHLKRIAPTRFYAMGQDNNHGTSEACALFVGATILLSHGSQPDTNTYIRWQRQGRYWLENRVNKLIEPDGAFSQYSTNYHRVMLDTLSFAEQIRLRYKAPRFSQHFYQKAQAATYWLAALTDQYTGDAPNLGANDGARLFPVTSCDYRDFRPSVQWASGLFCGSFIFRCKQPYQQLSDLLSPQNKVLSHQTEQLDLQQQLSTQVQLIQHQEQRVYLRTPSAKFRPSSCDALHLDFWLDSHNILRDAGTFSYNSSDKKLNYYGSTQAHNTVQFDDREPMPRLSRFLFSHWQNTKIINKSSNSISASCQTFDGNDHQRTITLTEKQLIVEDTLANFTERARCFWRLAPSNWQLSGNKVMSEIASISIIANNISINLTLVDGAESRYYLNEEVLPVLQVDVSAPGKITTIIDWAK